MPKSHPAEDHPQSYESQLLKILKKFDSDIKTIASAILEQQKYNQLCPQTIESLNKITKHKIGE